jgi:hypothetical protein
MTTYSKKEVGKYLRKELKEYEAMFNDMTEAERQELREWVAAGNDVNSNPHLLHSEDGWPMDFIAASRIAEEMAAHPEDFRWSDLEEGEELYTDEEPF